MQWWHWAALGGAVLVAGGGGAALIATSKREDAGIGPPLLTSEEARLLQLIPDAQMALRRLRNLCADRGLNVYVGSTKRSEGEQAANVAKGVSATQHSWHLLGRAVDLYPVDPETGKPDLQGKKLELFRLMHEIAGTIGPQTGPLGWRGLAFNSDGSKRYITTSKGKVWDGGHLEYPEGMTFAQAAATPITAKGAKLA